MPQEYEPKKFKLKFEHYVQQIKQDLIGKDAYRGVSLTYAWFANQFGHISLGFITALVAFKALKHFNAVNSEYKAVTISCTFWLLFEIYNVLKSVPLRRKHRKALNGEVPVFEAPLSSITLDVSTDILFFWIGALLAAYYLSIAVPTYLFVAMVIFALLATYYWITVRIFLQNARLPLQFRLAQWQKTNIDKQGQSAIAAFLKGKYEQMIIFGPPNSGKSLLAVAIANEVAASMRPVQFTTFLKFCSSLHRKDNNSSTQQTPWSQNEVQLLVLDDVDSALPSLNMSTAVLKQLTQDINMCVALANKQTVWVIEEVNPQKQLTWQHWIASLQAGTRQTCVHLIDMPL